MFLAEAERSSQYSSWTNQMAVELANSYWKLLVRWRFGAVVLLHRSKAIIVV